VISVIGAFLTQTGELAFLEKVNFIASAIHFFTVCIFFSQLDGTFYLSLIAAKSFSIALFLLYKLNIRPTLDGNFKKGMSNFWSLGVLNFVTKADYLVDRVILSHFGEGVLSVYAFSTQFVTPVSTIMTKTIFHTQVVNVRRLADEKNVSGFNVLSSNVLRKGLAIAFTFLLFVTMGYLLSKVFQIDFLSGHTPLFFVLLSIYLTTSTVGGSAYICSSLIYCLNRPGAVLKTTLLLSVIFITLKWLFRGFDILYFSMLTLLHSFFIFFVLKNISLKIYKFQIKLGNHIQPYCFFIIFSAFNFNANMSNPSSTPLNSPFTYPWSPVLKFTTSLGFT
jgi:hypothetical protein